MKSIKLLHHEAQHHAQTRSVNSTKNTSPWKTATLWAMYMWPIRHVATVKEEFHINLPIYRVTGWSCFSFPVMDVFLNLSNSSSRPMSWVWLAEPHTTLLFVFLVNMCSKPLQWIDASESTQACVPHSTQNCRKTVKSSYSKQFVHKSTCNVWFLAYLHSDSGKLLMGHAFWMKNSACCWVG